MTPEQRLDKYYQKKFGWTLAEVDAMFALQGNVCAACKRPPGERRMSVDHDHAFDRIKTVVHKVDRKTKVLEVAGPVYIRLTVTKKTSKVAKDYIRRTLRRASVRGGLCLRCNKGLAMFEDSKAPLPPAERLENLAAYLRKFAQKS